MGPTENCDFAITQVISNTATLLFSSVAFKLEIVVVYANLTKGKSWTFTGRDFLALPTVIIDYMLYPEGRTEFLGQQKITNTW